MTKSNKKTCKCENEAIPCWECTQKSAEERDKHLDKLITEYYRDKKMPGQPPPIPR